MMKNLALMAIVAMAAVAISAASAPAATIGQWTFESDTGTYTYPNPALNNPVPEVGAGSAMSLGMANSYTYNGGEGPGSLNWCDTTNGAGGGDGTIVWRIRGPSNVSGGGAGQANGWNSAAPQYTQGAQFNVSTAGYSNVQFAFDWMPTTQGVADLQPRYSTNGGSTWQNVPASSLAGWAPYTNNQAGPWSPVTAANGVSLLEMQNAADVNVNMESFLLNLTNVPGVANNPNFEVQLVSAYNPTLGTTYDNAKHASSGTGTSGLNNSSGNWRFDNITVSGTAVPEPTSFILLIAGAFGLAGYYVRRKRNG